VQNLISFLGVFVMLGLAWALSGDRRRVDFRSVAIGLGLQFAVAAVLLWSAPGQSFFALANRAVLKLIQFSNAGAQLVFGEKYTDHFFAFSVLPSIIFLSSLMAILFYLGVMQKVVGAFARLVRWALRVSGAEATVASARIFVGGVEAAFTIRPYLDTLTRSELFAIGTAGMATVASGVLAAFAGMGIDAGHLLCAQVLSAIGSLIIAKVMLPETEEPQTRGSVKIEVPRKDVNVLDAACRGAVDGLHVAAIVGALLVVFVALTAMINFFLGELPAVAGGPLSVERVLGWIFTPLVFFTGAEWKDCGVLGTLLGKKMFLNEFMAFLDLKGMREVLTPRSFTLAIYFLCGFANFSATAIQIGGLSSLMPARRTEIASIGIRCLIGGTLTSLLSACIAGVLT
jgi:CNT family concentrative nucleoside transporter